MTHGHSMEVLAAGLGHLSYASFRHHDEARLPRAHFAVLSFEAMERRASTFGLFLSPGQFHDVVRTLNSRGSGTMQPLLRRLESQPWPAQDEVYVAQHPGMEAMARSQGLQFEGVTVLLERPLGQLVPDAGTWSWLVSGSVHGTSGREPFDIPFDATVVFPRLGRHLFAQGVVSAVMPSGPPVTSDEDYLDEGYLSESGL